MNPTTATTTTVTTTTTTTTVSPPATPIAAQNPGPTMKLRDRGVVSDDIYETPNPLVRMGEEAVASLKDVFFTVLDDKWIALFHILTDVSEIPYSPSGDEFLSGLETVVGNNKHRFQALRALRDKMVCSIDGKETTAQVQVILDLFNLLLEMESPSDADPYVALIHKFDSAQKICKQLDTVLTSAKPTSAPRWKQADND